MQPHARAVGDGIGEAISVTTVRVRLGVAADRSIIGIGDTSIGAVCCSSSRAGRFGLCDGDSFVMGKGDGSEEGKITESMAIALRAASTEKTISRIRPSARAKTAVRKTYAAIVVS